MPDRNDSPPRDAQHYSDGFDMGLEPVQALDLSRVHSFSDLLTAMASTSFGGRALGEAADILTEMASDPECLVVGSFSGAMTVAKQGLVLCDMIDNGLIDVVVSTGALICHGLTENTGGTHFKVPHGIDDRAMYYAGFDRVYDTLELERSMDHLERVVDEVLRDWPVDKTVCSSSLLHELGRWLTENTEGRGILRSAYEKGVPVYVPAFSDSEIGLDYAAHNARRDNHGVPRLSFDPFLDLYDYVRRYGSAERRGIFTIGGGVPRNWAQQAGPYLEVEAHRQGEAAVARRFRYGVRICPEPVHWGGLSGCTYSEGVSWGKFVPPSDGGRFAEVPADATLVWPLLVKGVLERLGA